MFAGYHGGSEWVKGWRCCLGDDNDGEMSGTRSWCCRCFGDDNDGEVSEQGVGVALELPLPWR